MAVLPIQAPDVGADEILVVSDDFQGPLPEDTYYLTESDYARKNGAPGATSTSFSGPVIDAIAGPAIEAGMEGIGVNRAIELAARNFPKETAAAAQVAQQVMESEPVKVLEDVPAVKATTVVGSGLLKQAAPAAKRTAVAVHREVTAVAGRSSRQLAAGTLANAPKEANPIVASVVGAGGVKELAETSKLRGTYRELRRAGAKDGHHIAQEAAVKDLEGYSRSDAPAIQLDGPSTAVGSEHYMATQAQRSGPAGTLGAEREVAQRALAAAGLPGFDIRAALHEFDLYFYGILGHKPTTPTRVPGNRKVSE